MRRHALTNTKTKPFEEKKHIQRTIQEKLVIKKGGAGGPNNQARRHPFLPSDSFVNFWGNFYHFDRSELYQTSFLDVRRLLSYFLKYHRAPPSPVDRGQAYSQS